MRSSLRKTLTLGFALAGAALFPGLVHAQGKAQVEPPVFDSIPSPEVNTGKAKPFKPKDWLEIESKMRIPAYAAPNPAEERLSSASFALAAITAAIKH